MERNNDSLNAAIAQNTLDAIPTPLPNAMEITGIVKQSGRIIGYRLSDKTVVAKDECIELVKQGEIKGVGIAHRGDTIYLKSIPDGTEDNNLSTLPVVKHNFS